jgi:hypothetical protein
MKNRVKFLLIAAVATVSLSGCTKLWEEECTVCVPLPGTEIPVTPEPWEPGETDEKPVGE